MTDYVIPLIVRGKLIETDLISFTARRGEVTFKVPDVTRHIDEILLSDLDEMEDLYSITVDEIIDYLRELGPRLAPERNPHIRLAQEMCVLTSGQSEPLLRHMYRAMSANLNRSFLEELVDHNIGREYIEGWNQRSLADRDVWVRAFGARTVHLNAGNAPAVAIFALINGALLRCDNIVKSPSNDPFTAAAIALSMIEMAPDHPLTRHMTVCYWKGGDERFEKHLYRPSSIDKIVAWGGAASMAAVRKYLVPGLDLVALDPKISASILGPEALADERSIDEAAERLARDVGYYNQEGCLNSRVAYVVCGTDEDALDRLNAFGARVSDWLQRLPENLSSREHPSFDPVLRDEIRGLRLSEDVKIFGCQQSEGGAIVSQTNEPVDFRDRLSGRVINIVPVGSVAEAVSYVNVDTQTIGVYPEKLKLAVRDKCILRGAQRITDLGCATFEGMAYPHDGLELMRRMVRWGVMERFEPEIASRGTGLVHVEFDPVATACI